MSTHHGFIKEFPFIRVDAFDGDPVRVNPYSDHAPLFYLLTHSHTDHFGGLDSPTFEGEIFCTPVTRHLVLNTMEAGERVRATELPNEQGSRKRKFANLWKKPAARRGSASGKSGQERIKPIQINQPITLDGPHNPVTITALDANHCPGSCMFLIEGVVNGVHKAVLITGDVRAETFWVDALRLNPAVSKYVRWSGDILSIPSSSSKGKERESELWAPLDCIYLDTTAVTLDDELVPKKEAVEELVRLMAAYPADTKFFLNAWTWGYEEILKGVALAFNTRIHVDWYKHKMYGSAEMRRYDPLLADLGRRGPTRSRFHACERRWKCDAVWVDGRGCFEFAPEHVPHLKGPKKLKTPGKGRRDAEDAKVVYVNPSAMTRRKWEVYKASMKDTVRRVGEVALDTGGKRPATGGATLPNCLIVPLARHSSLPELRALVSLFKPQTLYPLTIHSDAQAPCRDYLALHALFGPHLAPGGADQLKAEAREYTKALVAKRTRPCTLSPLEASTREIGEENLELFIVPRATGTDALNVEGGDEIAELVERWARPDEDVPRARSPKRARRDQQPVLPSSSFAPRLDHLAHPPARTSLSPRVLVPATPSSAPNLLPSPHIHPPRASCSVGADLGQQAESRTFPRATLKQAGSSSRPSEKSVTFLSPVRSVKSQPSSPFVSLSPARASLPSFAATITGASPELFATTPSPIRAPLPTLVPARTSQRGTPHPMISARPTLESRDHRRRLTGAIIRSMGGRLGPNNVIVPLERGDPMWEYAYAGRDENGMRVTGVEKAGGVEQCSFQTVSASGSEGAGRGTS